MWKQIAKAQKTKESNWIEEQMIEIAKKKRKAKTEKDFRKEFNKEFQRTTRRDKKQSFGKDIKVGKGKTREVLQKISKLGRRF